MPVAVRGGVATSLYRRRKPGAPEGWAELRLTGRFPLTPSISQRFVDEEIAHQDSNQFPLGKKNATENILFYTQKGFLSMFYQHNHRHIIIIKT